MIWLILFSVILQVDLHAAQEEEGKTMRFFLTTTEGCHSTQELILDDTDSILNSIYNTSLPLTFVVHGFQNDRNSLINKRINHAYRFKGGSNVIIVDWSFGSLKSLTQYDAVACNLKPYAQQLAKFIDFLSGVHQNMFNVTTIVGHSLGSHVAGLAGKYVTRGKVDMIVGLDPAGPGFHLDSPDERLNVGDATFVKVIHTDIQFGFPEPIGDADFFVNGGEFQPGCSQYFHTKSQLTLPIKDLQKQICSHSRAWEYFAESVESNQFTGIQCSESFQKTIENGCTPTGIAMKIGEIHSYERKKGIFYVKVQSTSPYAIEDSPDFNENYSFRQSTFTKILSSLSDVFSSLSFFGNRDFSASIALDLFPFLYKEHLLAQYCGESFKNKVINNNRFPLYDF